MVGMGDSEDERDSDPDVTTAEMKLRNRADEYRAKADELGSLAKGIREMRQEVERLEETHGLTEAVDEHLDQARAGVVADSRELHDKAQMLDDAADEL